MKRLEERLIENEVVFRHYNEQVEKGFKDLKKTAQEQHWDEDVEHDDTELYFFCECSDENCKKRVLLKPSEYSQIHDDRTKFIVACGHEIPKIEEVIEKGRDYYIVRKYEIPPESADHLHRTPIINS